MDFTKFVEWTFYAFITGIGAYLAKVIGDVRESIERLNTTVAVEITKNGSLKEALEEIKTICRDHGQRLCQIEQKTFNCHKDN